ncbi:hypothetical protein J1P26_19880 [Neobacillus sp. MM2021_6]|uniref:XF1762 family protein n=1 Tax=Bacillaceae TaxID=186817 RepID=UPI00140A8BFE|nr:MULTISPECIES: XF1762 family protein [Bacillaceae]MBO0961968.1 hypothetical protein [Neobacillus sp. MM2021_6]NHC20335.1 hypothetical protein [Bacillus sp. MM2020_4]
MKYKLQPITLKEAQLFVNEYHRHNVSPQGHKFSIGLNNGEKIIGVVMVGRPVARHNDDGWTLEVIRCCVIEGYKDACSMLYAASWRVARNLGYNRLITYTLKEEPGSSLKAAGYKIIGETKVRPKGWDTPSRPRVKAERYPEGQKTIWEIN